ncbi:MAG: hypothetical protein D6690_07330 [Nitrospirae bacterium]|nr:MAG: hypothetical protein D6690_07330 [Nitrospirota bacterium]
MRLLEERTTSCLLSFAHVMDHASSTAIEWTLAHHRAGIDTICTSNPVLFHQTLVDVYVSTRHVPGSSLPHTLYENQAPGQDAAHRCERHQPLRRPRLDEILDVSKVLQQEIPMNHAAKRKSRAYSSKEIACICFFP